MADSKSLVKLGPMNMTESLSLPALSGENVHEIEQLQWEVRQALRPVDAIENIWVHDIARYTWEARRWTRFSNTLLDMFAKQCMESWLVERHCPVTEADEIALRWPSPKSKDIKFMNKYFRKWQLGPEYFYASAAAAHRGELDWFDRQIAAAESRRDAIVRELDRHREAARRLEGRRETAGADANFRLVADRPNASH